MRVDGVRSVVWFRYRGKIRRVKSALLVKRIYAAEIDLRAGLASRPQALQVARPAGERPHLAFPLASKVRIPMFCLLIFD